MKLLEYLIAYNGLIPAIVALIRFRKINKIYYLFIYLIWLGCFNDLLSDLLMSQGYWPGLNNNIYVLIESLILIWFLKGFTGYNRFSKLLLLIYIIITGVWVIESVYQENLFKVNSYFRMVYSFIIILLSIVTINNTLISSKGSLLKNPVFLLCCGFLLMYTTKIVVEVFYKYGENLNAVFRSRIFAIFIYANFLANIIYTIAILWMPRRQVFTLPS